ncbi:SapC family protein [Oceanospirillaceae bacterium]|jgi:hypothetical protein|nr:SapC family protein [Oceanospirillaceae bacterium]
MFEQLVPVTLEAHRSLKVLPWSNFNFAKGFHMASVMVHEFVRAAAVYPIVFLEDDKTSFKPVVMIGLEAGANLFVSDDGQWHASYVPAIIRRYPFALVKHADADANQFTVYLDKASKLFNETTGEALFDEQGEPTQVIKNVKAYLSELQRMEVFTTAFCDFLKTNDLLTPLSMQVVASDQQQKITGSYVINEERLNNLSDTLFLNIKAKGYLPAIYAHLTSLSQIERLAMLQKVQTSIASNDDQVDSDN